jgi:retron-type reverse transcriptase
MITLDDCHKTRTIEESTIYIINKIAFIQRKGYTRSTDNQTYWEFATKILTKLKTIKNQLNNQTLHFAPYREIKRKTKPNKWRNIYLSTWHDKIIERWLSDCLNILLHKWFSNNSYAYRIEGVGLDSCISDVTRAIQHSQYFAKRDITQYFYTINHDILLSKLEQIIDKNDYLYTLLTNRIKFQYEHKDELRTATLGVPFGSPLACVLANIYLTQLDKEMRNYKIRYFRYADDFLICGTDGDEVRKATEHLDQSLTALKLTTKSSHTQNMSFIQHDGFELTNRFKHLGLEFMDNGTVKMAVEKQRKIINLFKRTLKHNKQIHQIKDDDQKLKAVIDTINDTVNDRIRSAAIIDYYLKHVNDDVQLRNMDRLIAELAISTTLNKEFRKGHFKLIPYKKLRNFGLLSLLHRNRLHRHGHLHINFLSMFNELIVKRHDHTMLRRAERIDHMYMARKIKTHRNVDTTTA